MRGSGWTPSIVPEIGDQNIYLVMDDLGRLGSNMDRGGRRDL